jgi:glycosyltransferase involved in cell wall biosynthesis
VKISVIIPVYNEARTLAQVLERVCSAPLPRSVELEIRVVDDGSTDGASAVLRQFRADPKVHVLTLGRNRGKTGALLAGLAVSEGEYVIFQDADLEYDPIHYEKLLAPVLAGEAPVVLGSRFLGTIENMRPLIRLANRFNTWFVNRLYRSSLTDVNTGFKVLPRDLLKSMRIVSGRFGGDAEIISRLLKMRKRIVEVPIHYVARSKEEGKKMDWFHALHMFWCFIFHRFSYAGR